MGKGILHWSLSLLRGNQADMAAMAQQDETGMNAADDSAILDKDQYGQMQYP